MMFWYQGWFSNSVLKDPTHSFLCHAASKDSLPSGQTYPTHGHNTDGTAPKFTSSLGHIQSIKERSERKSSLLSLEFLSFYQQATAFSKCFRYLLYATLTGIKNTDWSLQGRLRKDQPLHRKRKKGRGLRWPWGRRPIACRSISAKFCFLIGKLQPTQVP